MINVSSTIDSTSYKVINPLWIPTKGIQHNEFRFTIVDSPQEEEFTMLNEIELNIDDNTTFIDLDDFYIQSDIVTPYSFTNETYQHEISCIERAYKLEKHTGITRVYVSDNLRTLWDIIEELRLTVPLSIVADNSATRLFELSSNLDVLKTIIAPDLTFNDLTLRECLIQVFDEANAYPILTKGTTLNVLDIVYYNRRLNRVDKKNKSVYRTLKANVNDYASELDTNASNLVNTSSTIGGAIFEPSIGEYMGLRSDAGFFNSDDAYLPVDFSKYRKVQILQKIPTQTLGDLVINITDHIVEQDEYALLLDDTIFPDNLLGKYKTNSLIWNFKDNKVTGFYKELGIINFDPVIERIAKSGIAALYDANTAQLEYKSQNFYELEFNVIYSSDFNARMKVQRLDNDDVNKVTSKPYNQSSNFTSPNKLLRNMFSTIQKKGNNEYISTVESTDLSELYDLNYYTADRYVLTSMQILFNPYSYTANYFWTKNDNKIPDRIAINSKLELFNIPGEDRQLVRNEYYEEFIFVSDEALPTEESTALNGTGMDIILNNLRQTQLTANDKPPLAVSLFSSDIDLYEDPLTGVSTKLTGTGRLGKSIQSWGGGNSLNLYYKYDSPLIAGSERVVIDGKQTLRAFRYTDKNGELQNLDLDFCHKFNNIDIDKYPRVNTPLDTISVQLNDLVLYLNVAERSGFTYAVHLIPTNADNIGFGNNFFERNNFVEYKSGVFTQLFASNCSSRYDRTDTKTKDVVSSAGSWTITNNTISLNVDSTAESWVLSDVAGNIYMYVNQRNLDGTFTTRNGIQFKRYKNRIDMEAL